MKEQSQCRRRVLLGLRDGGTLPDLISHRNLAESHAAHMIALLYLGGEPCEMRQRAAVAQALRRGDSDEGIQYPLRAYRGLTLAEGKLDREFLERTVDRMTNPKYWVAMPARGRTVKLRAENFSAFGRSIALGSDMEERNAFYPLKGFRLIKESEIYHGCWRSF